ncbi:MAG: 4Fe-4S binding protein [Deltaproteobacteria bacterium]|nr:MAG: 4Fe-4S binding protein [Deltaproteobacteria bacterium]
MTDVYERLAKKLDDMPNGYPSTESGIELKILRKIFTPEEAEIALRLKPMPETVETIAERLEKPVPEMQTILDNMTEKGQIASLKAFGHQVYVLPPFAVGIVELQVNRMDKELAELIREYEPTLVKTVGSFAPAMLRVVPVSAKIHAGLQVHPYEDVRRMMEEAKSFQLAECICRKEAAMEGRPCKHTLEACLSFSREEGAFDKYPIGKIISKEEALKVLANSEEEGLIHSTYNVEDSQPISFICNCCSCCCGIFRWMNEYKAPYILAKSSYWASIDQENCTACGTCADERCPVDAIVEEGDTYRVVAEHCIGCGVCIPACSADAITLIPKPESEQDKTPASLIEWSLSRAASRGVEFKTD